MLHAWFCKEKFAQNWPEILCKHLGNEAIVMRITRENHFIHSPDYSFSCDFESELKSREDCRYDSTIAGIVTKDCGVTIWGHRYLNDYHHERPYWIFPLMTHRNKVWSIAGFFRRNNFYLKLMKIIDTTIADKELWMKSLKTE